MCINKTDLICFSHLRWGFVYQRPQHLLSRFARDRRVFFVEEPIHAEDGPRMETRVDPESGVVVVTPRLDWTEPAQINRTLGELLLQFMHKERIEDYLLWYYTPMALEFTRNLAPSLVIYDCMDELSGFLGAPPALRQREQELFDLADLVFTGGRTLYEAKRGQHPDVHCFPSSVDAAHFGLARAGCPDLPDQSSIPHPRIGFCGVIDERLDRGLLEGAARLAPGIHFVMIGPVVKIDPADLPDLPNIHYLGPKAYQDLPKYMAGWDAAMLPFARNESTRFISPTKTPEYLAAGLPSVSTSIRDVVRPYGELGLVEIADEPAAFVSAIQKSLAIEPSQWLPPVDAFLAQNSWDTTFDGMLQLIVPRLRNRRVTSLTA